MSQFIIATNGASAEERNLITNHIKSKGWGWWHHFEDLWMVATPAGDTTTSQALYVEVKNLPGFGAQTYLLVTRMAGPGSPMTHFGFGPPDGWKWTEQYWGKVG